MKLRVLAASLAALTLTAGVASAQTKPAAPAATTTPAMPVVDKTHASYAFGWQLGERLVSTGEPIDIATVVRGLQDAYGKKQPAYTEEQLGKAFSGFQQREQMKMAEAMRKAMADNEAQSAGFVAKYKAEQGVVTLPSGVMYRVLKAGTGAKATTASKVQIGYQSVLAAVGVPLGGLETPPEFTVSQFPIPALKETIPLMQQGAVWEVVIPPGKGAGDMNQRFAKQAVGLRVELGSVK